MITCDKEGWREAKRLGWISGVGAERRGGRTVPVSVTCHLIVSHICPLPTHNRISSALGHLLIIGRLTEVDAVKR